MVIYTMLYRGLGEREVGKVRGDVIAVTGLTKRFGAITAVDDISFSVSEGELFGFLGPNGAGKTTTIRMLTGILTPDAGAVSIGGIDIQKHPITAKMQMGIIPEMSNVYIELTAKQNVVLAGRFYGMHRKTVEERTDQLLAQFELSERKNDRVEGFSKGMKQRVLIASALVHVPKVLFLDEPTSGLDVHSQRLIRTIIREMNDAGTTVFLTTHNIEEANALCDRVGIIHCGALAAIDTPERLKQAFKETQSVEVAFDKPIDMEEIEHSGLVNRTERTGDKWRFYTDDPDALAKEVLSLAERRKLSFTALSIEGASLEDVFITVTEGKAHVK
ncbi:MAG: ATP-binding cassette domain-containing protein [Halobacteriota archaeon]